MNKKPAPESGRSARKSSQLVVIPSYWRVSQTQSAEVGRNWYFFLGRLSSRRTFACITDSLRWNWRGSCHTSPFSESPSAQAEMAQQGTCPEPWRSSSLALEPSNEWDREKEKSKWRIKSNKREQTPTRSPKRMEMKLNQAWGAQYREKSPLKTETLGFKSKP